MQTVYAYKSYWRRLHSIQNSGHATNYCHQRPQRPKTTFLSLCLYFLLVFFSFACFWLLASGEIKMHVYIKGAFTVLNAGVVARSSASMDSIVSDISSRVLTADNDRKKGWTLDTPAEMLSESNWVNCSCSYNWDNYYHSWATDSQYSVQ